jgi:hypothetical protein
MLEGRRSCALDRSGSVNRSTPRQRPHWAVGRIVASGCVRVWVRHRAMTGQQRCPSEKGSIRIQPEQHTAGRLHDPRVNPDMHRHRMHITESTLERAAYI